MSMSSRLRSVFWPRCKVILEAVFDGRGAANSKPYYFEIDPKSAEVQFNGYYEADTFSVDFDAKTFPFDPDQLAYGALRVYMWDSQKNVGRASWAIDDNLMVKGLVDDAEISTVGDDNTVKFSGRDYTALLLDAEWDPKIKIPSGKPLDITVQEIADKAAPKGTRARFTVEWRSKAKIPLCGGLHRDTKKKGLAQKPGKTYWEVIWDLCIAHAFTVRVESTEADRTLIIISEPQTETKESLADSPRLVFGESLTSLSIARKFAREKVPQVCLVTWDPQSGKKIEVFYPSKRNVDVNPLNERNVDSLGVPLTAKKDEIMYFPAPKGITDKDALLRYARMRFYHLGRGETTYKMETKHLWVPGIKPGTEENLLRLRPGKAIGVQFQPFNVATLRGMEEGARIAHIIAMGYNETVATFVALNLTRIELFKQDYYYNRGTVSYDETSGIEIEIEAQNFSHEVKQVNFAETADGIVIEEAD